MKDELKKYLFLFILFVLILPLNYFAPRPLGILNFLPGTVPVYIIATLFHPLLAAAAGLLSGAVAFYRYKSPLYILLYLLEAFFLSYMVKRTRRGDLVSIISFFWVAAGLPLYGVLEYFVFHQPFIYISMTGAALFLGSILCASAVTAVFSMAPLQKFRLIRQYRFNNSFNMLTSFCVLLIILVSMTVLMLEGRFYGRRYRNMTNEHMASHVRQIDGYMDEWMEEKNRSLAAAADLLEADDFTNSFPEPLFSFFLSQFPDFRQFALMEDDSVLYSYPDTVQPPALSQDNISRWSEPFVLPSGQIPLMSIRIPLEGNYFLLAVTGFDTLSELLRKVQTGRQISFSISDGKGRLLADSREQTVYNSTLHHLQGAEGELFVSELEKNFPVLDSNRGYSDTIHSGLWVLTIYESSNSTFSYVQQWVSRILLLLSLIVLIVVSVLRVLSNRLISKLDRLILQSSRNMYGLETEDDEEDWPESSIWEVSHLSYRLKEIMSHQKKAASLLNRQNQKLEEMNLALVRSEENLRITLNSIADGVIASNEQGYLTSINPVASRLTGYLWDEEEQVRVDQVLILKDEFGCDLYSGFLCEVLEKGEIIDSGRRFLLEHNGGGTAVVTLGAAPIRENKRSSIKGAVIVIRDISESRELEEQLRQSQKMEVVGQLAGGIAHDFNNILGGILGIISMMKLDLQEDENHCESEFDGIITLIKRAADLTAKLLSFSRKGKLISSSIDFHSVITETRDLLFHTFPEDVTILCELSALRSIVQGDPTEIQRVLMNLALNARDAMPDGGTLRFVTGNIDGGSRIETLGGEVELEQDFFSIVISDTGSGINEDLFSRIFEPFFTTKEIGRGSGLGLSAVYGSILEHQGFINVDSKVGKGTEFSLYFPLVEGGSEKVLDN